MGDCGVIMMKKHNNLTGKNAGFTLVEIIVVLVILAILAAFAIPAYLGFVSNSQASLCETQRKDIVRLFETRSRLIPGLEINAFTADNYGDLEHLCPGGGVYRGYSYYEAENQAIGVMYCSVHSENTDAQLYIDTQVLLEKLKGMTDDEKRAYLGITNSNFSNDTFRAKILQDIGGEWELISQSVLDKTTYQKNASDLRIQPYFFGDKWSESIIYANPAKDMTGTNLWSTNLVYNHENGKWYEYIEKMGDMIQSYSMTKLNSKTWAQFKEELNDTSRWRAVE